MHAKAAFLELQEALPPVCELQSIELAGAAVIQKCFWVDYRSVSSPLALYRLVQQLLLPLLLHYSAGVSFKNIPEIMLSFGLMGSQAMNRQMSCGLLLFLSCGADAKESR